MATRVLLKHSILAGRRMALALGTSLLCTWIFAAPWPALAADAAAVEKPRWRMDASDATMRNALHRWASTAGWQLVWELPVDFPIEARAEVDGSFEDAVASVIRSMEASDLPMRAVFYSGNKVLRVLPKGAQ